MNTCFDERLKILNKRSELQVSEGKCCACKASSSKTSLATGRGGERIEISGHPGLLVQ